MSHLNDDAIYRLVAGEGDATMSAHLETCERCQNTFEMVRSARSVLLSDDRAPSLFAERRMHRELDLALDREVLAQRRAWRPIRVMASLTMACFAGASLAYGVVTLRADDTSVENEVQVDSVRVLPEKSEVIVPAPSEVLSDDKIDVPLFDASTKKPKRKRVRKVTRESKDQRTLRLAADMLNESCKVGAIDIADELERMGEFNKAAKLYSGALCSVRGHEAAEKLQTQVRRGDIDAVIASEMIRQNARAKTSRNGGNLLCEWGLKYRKNGLALDDCAAFVEQHSRAPRAQVLSYAAGRVSVRQLDDAKRALPFFTFAIENGDDAQAKSAALFERAKAFASLGRLAEAREDLSVYRRRVAPELRRDGFAKLAARLASE